MFRNMRHTKGFSLGGSLFLCPQLRSRPWVTVLAALANKKYIYMVYNNKYIFSEILIVFFRNITKLYCIPCVLLLVYSNSASQVKLIQHNSNMLIISTINKILIF